MPIPNSDSLAHSEDTAIIKNYGYTHIFSNHELKKTSDAPLINEKSGSIWPIIIFTIGFILLVMIRVTGAKRFFTLLKAYFSLGAAKQLMREDYKLNKGSSVLFSIVFVLHFSFFIFKINSYYGYIHYPFNDFIFYILIAFSIVIAYSFKIIIARAFASLALAANEMDEYIFNTFLSTNAIGLFLFPVIICMEYSTLPAHALIIAGIIILLLFYLIRIGKGLVIAYVSRRFSIFHLFLYLCALEILPLIVIIKLLVSRIF